MDFATLPLSLAFNLIYHNISHRTLKAKMLISVIVQAGVALTSDGIIVHIYQ